MGPRPRPKQAVRTDLSVRTARLRSRTGAGVTGAGSGALFLHLLKGYQDHAWAQILLYLAPSLSLAVSAGVLWLRAQLDEYVRRKLRNQKQKGQLERFEKAKKIFLDVIEDQNASMDSKEEARQALSRLHTLKTKIGLEIAEQSD